MEPDINKLTSEAVQLLKEIIAIPSPSFYEEAVCDHVSAWMTDKGIAHERVGNNIIAEYIADKDGTTLMFCAHLDTVGASPDYSFDPYNPDYQKAAEVISRIRNCETDASEIVAGLGSNDDGASAVAMLAAFRYLSSRKMEKSPYLLGSNLILVLSCEEERSGKNGMTELWKSRFRNLDESEEGYSLINFAIVGEPTGMKAAVAERGLLVIDATAHGVSGHAARNEGVNALYTAMEDIDKLRRHEFSKISPSMGKVNLNVTQINAGTAHNVIPDRCDFVIDIRPTEQYDNEEILKELQGICKSELKARNLANRSSATEGDSLLRRIAEENSIDTFTSPTTSDWMRIRCDAIKMGPGDSSRSHKKDEYVLVSEIAEGIKTYIEFFERYEHIME